MGESSSKAWIDAKCAYDELKTKACRPDKGETGWAPVHKCHPCPLECFSCEDRTTMFSKKNKKFKCNLRYEEGPGDKLAGLMRGKSAPSVFPPNFQRATSAQSLRKNIAKLERVFALEDTKHTANTWLHFLTEIDLLEA